MTAEESTVHAPARARPRGRGNALGFWFFRTALRFTGLRGAYGLLYFVAPYLQGLPFLPRTALLTALIVMTMTWGVMPRLTRWMRGFLNPHAKK